MDDFKLAQYEAERLHVFFGAWFRGELTADVFERECSSVLHPQFENVQPSGATLTRSDIVSIIETGRGTNPDFQIQIEAPRLLGSWPGLILFQYIEFQTGARSSERENRRLSTVMFERNGDQLIWRYLTEVGLAAN